jgi:hypothetical protein
MIHLGAMDENMNNFAIRKGNEWAIRLLTDWSRIEIGNIFVSDYISTGNCWRNNCSFLWRNKTK